MNRSAHQRPSTTELGASILALVALVAVGGALTLLPARAALAQPIEQPGLDDDGDDSEPTPTPDTGDDVGEPYIESGPGTPAEQLPGNILFPYDPGSGIKFLIGCDLGFSFFDDGAGHRAQTATSLDAQPLIAASFGYILPIGSGFAFGNSLIIGWQPGDFFNVDLRTSAWIVPEGNAMMPEFFATFRLYDFSGNNLVGLAVGGGVAFDLWILNTTFAFEFQILYAFFDTTGTNAIIVELRFPFRLAL